MKVRYMGPTSFLELTNNRVYEVMSIEGDWYRIVDDSHDDYLYPPDEFVIVEENDGTTPVSDTSDIFPYDEGRYGVNEDDKA